MNKILITMSLVWILAACGSGGGSSATGGTEAGNAGTVSLRVIAYQSSTLATLTVNNLEIDTAQVVLDQLEFRPFSNCGGEGSEDGEDLRIEGPFVVDLLNPEAISGLEEVKISEGRYCRIDLEFDKLEDDELPEGVDPSDPIAGRSIYIAGMRGDGTRFQMTTEVDEEFELENEETGFLIDESILNGILFIAFDLDQWFSGVNLSDSSVEVSNGMILINDDQNEEIQETIEDNIKLSADLFEDEDGNEELDRDEQEDSLAAGGSTP